MLRSFFQIAVSASVLAVVAGVGWIAFGEISTSEAAHADAGFLLVSHQTEKLGDSLKVAGTFIGAEVSENIAQIGDISALLDEWTPKYRRAETGYRKFDAAIGGAEDRAEAYFAAQRALTARIHDEELSARARAEDDAEFHQYEQWRGQSRRIRLAALEIMQGLGDMDATLQKMKLRSDFSFDAGTLLEVPSSILALENDLVQFRIASDNVRQTIDSPFDGKS